MHAFLYLSLLMFSKRLCDGMCMILAHVIMSFNLCVSFQVRAWIIPSDYNHAEAEAKHLIYEADSDENGELTKLEILDKYDIFVGSQATDFGEALVRHDEF